MFLYYRVGQSTLPASMMFAEKYTALFDIKYILKASADVLYVSVSEFEMHTTRCFFGIRILQNSVLAAGGAYDAPQTS